MPHSFYIFIADIKPLMFKTPVWGPAAHSNFISVLGTVTRFWHLGERALSAANVAILCFDVHFPSRRRVLTKCLKILPFLLSASPQNYFRGEGRKTLKEKVSWHFLILLPIFLERDPDWDSEDRRLILKPVSLLST